MEGQDAAMRRGGKLHEKEDLSHRGLPRRTLWVESERIEHVWAHGNAHYRIRCGIRINDQLREESVRGKLLV
jgi:hypothetical protein